jgi:hypothetical protein
MNTFSTRNYGLLSFGNEAEEDEEEISKISMVDRFVCVCSCVFILFVVDIQTERNWQECS